MTIKSNLFQWRRVQILSATFFCISLTFISCKKKETMIGKTALEEASLLNSSGIDTFQLKTYTIEEDSVPTKNSLHVLLGAYNDPEFGTVNANFYTQFSLANPGVTTFPSGADIDSVILSLQYTGYYGDATAQTFEVYKIGTDLQSNKDSLYYSTNTRALDGGNIVVPGQGTITPKPSSYTIVGGDSLIAHLRIPLLNSFGSDLIAGAGNYVTQDAFRAFFKGLHVKVANQNPAAGTGGIFYFNLSALNSKLTVYYKDDTLPKSFSYFMNGESVDFTHMDFNRTGKPIDNVIANPSLGQSKFYAQAFTSRAVIEFPGVNNIPKNAIVHKAQLILPVSHYTNSLLYPSVQLNYGTKVSADNDVIYSLGTAVYNDALKAYVINLRSHLENLVSKQIENHGLYLRPSFFNSTVERIIFNGTEGDIKKKPKLVVTYTTY